MMYNSQEGDEDLFGLSMWELLVVLVVILLIFGPKKLPEMGKAIGSAVREFRQAGQEAVQEMNTDSSDEGQASRRDDS